MSNQNFDMGFFRETTDSIKIDNSKKIYFSDFFYAWIENGVFRADNNNELERLFSKDVLPLIGQVRLREVASEHLLGLLRVQRERGVTRMSIVTLNSLRQLFRWGMQREPWCAEIGAINPASQIVLKQFVPRSYESVRDRVLSNAEIWELGRIFSSISGDYHNSILDKKSQIAVWLCLSSLCRIGELLQARWENVNLESGIWYLPKVTTKGRIQDHVIFMSEFIHSKFVELFKLTGNSQWCFPSRNNQGHVDLKSITKQISDRQIRFKNRTVPRKGRVNSNALVLADGLRGDWTPHDLRRTGATMMQALGVPLEVIDRCQNHVLAGSKVRRHYMHHDYAKERAEAWQKLGQKIEEILSMHEHQFHDEFLGIKHPLHKPHWLQWRV
ncbi:tyrosine-type recombinase/integrase [Paenalcaligenes sp. Me131]|uniref:tyrosine-type recombinase/integrase n=1 Tax=Paenalcaligenes sp. Me131 TaxID=3392636 RepID=UPI003D298519